MAAPERFVNFDTGQPQALRDAANSVFGASGAGHAAGLVPDPGAVAGTTRFLREDGAFQPAGVSQTLVDLQFFFDGQGSVLLSGAKMFIHIPFSGTITAWRVMGDVSGSITFDVLRTHDAFPVTSIVGAGNAPTLSSAQFAEVVPSGWTSTTLAVDDWVEALINGAPSSVKQCNLCLTCLRNL